MNRFFFKVPLGFLCVCAIIVVCMHPTAPPPLPPKNRKREKLNGSKLCAQLENRTVCLGTVMDQRAPVVLT